MAINDIYKVRSAYAEFRRDRLEQFIVDVRRTRAGQIKMLLSNTSAPLDIETFEREVWRIESFTYLRDRAVQIHIYSQYYEQTRLLDTMSKQQISLQDLETALHTGQLELHGNYIFGQASAIFAPMFKDQALRISLLKQGLLLLNESGLTPLEKVQNVYTARGFGENIATGLGMIFHPEAIGLVNAATRDVLQKMGHTSAKKPSWRELQDVLRSLHIILRTRDFIELDWFLYEYGRAL